MQSLKENKKGIFLIILSSICVCIGQLFWKLGANGSYMYIIFGFCLYGTGALLMLISYKYGSLSVLQPMLSLNYVITIFLSYFVLNEQITINKLIGIFIIIFGVILIGRGDRK